MNLDRNGNLSRFLIGCLLGGFALLIFHNPTAAGVITALAIAIWGKSLGQLFYRPNITIVSSLENLQVNQGQTRLLILNKGNATAEQVEVYVEEITDKGNKKRENFLPVPLSWTHDGRSQRNFHPNQYGYLDLCRIDDLTTGSPPKLVLVAGAGVPAYEDLFEGVTKLKLTIFQKSGQVIKYTLILEWKMGWQNVRVKKIIRSL